MPRAAAAAAFLAVGGRRSFLRHSYQRDSPSVRDCHRHERADLGLGEPNVCAGGSSGAVERSELANGRVTDAVATAAGAVASPLSAQTLRVLDKIGLRA